MADADSWATDAHKTLNVTYDCGIAAVRNRTAVRDSFAVQAHYLAAADPEGPGNPYERVPEMSRRARGVTVWAALRSLGRSGVAELVERCCVLARRFAERLGSEPGVEILNEVVLNQVLVRFSSASGDADALTRDVIAHVQADGTCWLGGTTWHGRAAMRISVSNWSTTAGDVDASAAAILRCFRAAC